MIRLLFSFIFGLVTGALAVLLVADRTIDLQDVRDTATEKIGEVSRGAQELGVAAAVKTSLSFQKDFALFGEIGVSVDDGVVTLTGMVATPEQRQRAELIAQGVRGVERVVNSIEVGSGNDPTSEAPGTAGAMMAGWPPKAPGPGTA